jgi:hypothetical protein
MTCLAALLAASSLQAADTAAQKSGTQSIAKLRYRYCTGPGDSYSGCSFPGKGYVVCERLLKALNSLPVDEPPPVCEIKLPKGSEDFSQPQWEDVPVADNMHMVYDMEQFLVNSDDNPIPLEWQQYYPEGWILKFEKLDPSTWRRVPFETWLERFKKQMAAGQVAPRIRRTRAALNANGPETILAYDRFPGGDMGVCSTWLKRHPLSVSGGSYLFLQTNEAERPVVPINERLGFDVRFLLLHRGTAYLAATYAGGIGALYVAMPPLPAHLQQDRWDYVMTERCDFSPNR